MDCAVRTAMNNSKSWVVGYFLDSNDTILYEVVPYIWLSFGSNNEIMCKWPAKKSVNVSNLSRKCKNLSKDFGYHRFALHDNAYYGSYDEASSKLQHIINSSESEGGRDLGRGLRKKKACSRSLFNDNNYDGSSSSDENTNVEPYIIEPMFKRPKVYARESLNKSNDLTNNQASSFILNINDDNSYEKSNFKSVNHNTPTYSKTHTVTVDSEKLSVPDLNNSPSALKISNEPNDTQIFDEHVNRIENAFSSSKLNMNMDNSSNILNCSPPSSSSLNLNKVHSNEQLNKVPNTPTYCHTFTNTSNPGNLNTSTTKFSPSTSMVSSAQTSNYSQNINVIGEENTFLHFNPYTNLGSVSGNQTYSQNESSMVSSITTNQLTCLSDPLHDDNFGSAISQFSDKENSTNSLANDNLHNLSSALNSSNFEDELRAIKSSLIVNNMMGERIWKKLNSLESEIKNLKSSMNSSAVFSLDNDDQLFLKLLPLSTAEDLELCENKLKTDTGLKEKLVIRVIHLKSIKIFFQNQTYI